MTITKQPVPSLRNVACAGDKWTPPSRCCTVTRSTTRRRDGADTNNADTHNLLPRMPFSENYNTLGDQPFHNVLTKENNSHAKNRNVEAKAVPSYVITDSEKSLDERVGHLGILADDAEARGDRQEAAARHEDCVEAATAAAAAREGNTGRCVSI